MSQVNLDNHNDFLKNGFKLSDPQKVTRYFKNQSNNSKLATLKIELLRLKHFLFCGFKWVSSNKLNKFYEPLSTNLGKQLNGFDKQESFSEEDKNTILNSYTKISNVVKIFEKTVYKDKIENLLNVTGWSDLLKKAHRPPNAPPLPPTGWTPPKNSTTEGEEDSGLAQIYGSIKDQVSKKRTLQKEQGSGIILTKEDQAKLEKRRNANGLGTGQISKETKETEEPRDVEESAEEPSVEDLANEFNNNDKIDLTKSSDTKVAPKASDTKVDSKATIDQFIVKAQTNDTPEEDNDAEWNDTNDHDHTTTDQPAPTSNDNMTPSDKAPQT